MAPRLVLRAVVGVAISVLAFVLVFRSVDPDVTARILAAAAPGWLLVVAVFLVVDILVRAVRWRRLLAPIRDVPPGAVLAYLLIGYLANNVLPARLGELVRCHYLGDRQGLSRTTALGTVVVERVVDIAVVVAIAAFAIIVLSIRGLVASAVLVGVAIVVLLVVALAIGIAAHRIPGAERVATAAARWPRLGELATKLRDGLAVAGRPRTLFEALALSVVAWGATLLAFAAAGQAVGIQLTVGQAALLAAGVALAAAIPSGPASLGTFELAGVRIAEAFGIASEPAFAIALLVHAAILVITSIGGIVALVRLGWRREPDAEARAAAATAMPETETAD
ncbi:MAG TPA: lysylphosphatidylglycerol synthase transmembrane domain-containing protein [Candidatus Limnocylindrales bacterium]|nr:lysylphosphatidylglycerol synthase transmembrane domain-containing protein [Candidatus Limnocylindrales bacterium]